MNIFKKSSISTKPQNAEGFLNKTFQNIEDIYLVSNFFVESIERAKEINAGRVSVNYRKDKQIIRVNVGRLEVVSLSEKGLLIVMHYPALSEKFREYLEGNWQYNEDRPTAYNVLRGSCRMRFSPEDLIKFYPTLREANDHLIALAALTGNNPWLSSNDDETIETLYSYKNNSNVELTNSTKAKISKKKSTEKRKILSIQTLLQEVSNDKNIKFDYKEIETLKNQMKKLPEIEYDILNIRYSIEAESTGQNITLQSIGDKYSLTRERIRQIEQQAVKKLRILFNAETKPHSEIPFDFLNNKTCKFLIKNNIETIGDLLKMTKQQLIEELKIDNKSLLDIEEMLISFGYRLKQNHENELNLIKLSTRLKNVLIENNLTKTQDFLEYPLDEFEYLTNIGEKSLNELFLLRKELEENLLSETEPVHNQNNVTEADYIKEVVSVEVKTNENLEPIIEIRIPEEFAEDLVLGDVEAISAIIRKIEEKVYNL